MVLQVRSYCIIDQNLYYITFMLNIGLRNSCETTIQEKDKERLFVLRMVKLIFLNIVQFKQ